MGRILQSYGIKIEVSNNPLETKSICYTSSIIVYFHVMSAGIQKNHILIALAILITLAVAWYALSPLLQNKVVNDSLPESVPQVNPSEKISQSIAVGESNPNGDAQPLISASFPIVDTPAHPASGTVRIVQSADETILRYEDYKTINGPDLKVYLAKDLEAKEYVDLGFIKGTEGNINYTVPQGIDISQYRYALTWCEDFSVLFNSADLSVSQ
jgi:hypothetical protein